jgi:hypothetical protein
MPNMKIHSSGGIVFESTKEEREVRAMKQELREELDEAKKLKEELLNLKKEMEGQ